MRRGIGTLSTERIAYVAVGAPCLVITWNGLRLAGGAVANVILVLAFAAVVMHATVTRRVIVPPPWLLAPAFGFLIAALLNVIFPPDAGLINQTLLEYRANPQGQVPGFLELSSAHNFSALIQFGIALVLIPLMIAFVADTPARVERLLDLFVISATVNAVVAVVDFMGVPISPSATVAGREAGLTIHPNYLALTCTIAIPLALLWVTRGGRWRKFGFLSTALLLGATYASGSRVGAIAALLGVVLSVVAIPRLRPGLAVVVPVVGLAALAIAFFAGGEVLEQVRFNSDVSNSVNISGSNSDRSEFAEVAWTQFQARPLQGVGFAVIADAHDIFLQLLAAGGVLALTSFLIFLGGLFSSARLARAGPHRDTATALALAILMWLASGILSNQLADKYLYIVPGLLMALALTTAATSVTPEARYPRVSGPRSGEPSPVGAR